MRVGSFFIMICTIGSWTFARADEVRTLTDSESSYVTPLEVPAPPPVAVSESAPSIVSLVDDVPMNRPFLMDTALGPTAFTLDQKQFQISPFDLRLVTFEGGLPAASWLHYGLFDFLTVGAGVGYDFTTSGYYALGINGWPVVAEVRLNFANTDQWSFGLSAAGRVQVGFDGESWRGRQSTSGVVSLVASGVLSPRWRLHEQLVFSHEHSTFTWTSYRSKRYVDSSNHAVLRWGNVFELRPAREHALTFGLAGVLDSLWRWGPLELSVNVPLSFGYHFISKNGFAIFAGLEAGPAFRVFSYYDYGVGFDGAISAGINFVL